MTIKIILFVFIMTISGLSIVLPPRVQAQLPDAADSQPPTVKDDQTIDKTRTFEKLNGYFIKNSVEFDENYDFMHMAFTRQKDFDLYFGVAKTMINRIDKINFEENSVIAIMTRPSLISKKIDLIYSEFNDDELFIKYNIRNGQKNSFTTTGLYLAKIPKNVSKIKFRSRYNVGEVDVK